MNDDLIPEGAHWHAVMINDMDKSSGTRAILAACPTIEEARNLLADELSGQPREADKLVAPEQRDKIYDDMRAGKMDYMGDPEFCIAIYPCTGEDDDACEEIGDQVTIHLIRKQAMLTVACPCAQHTAARAKASGGGAGLSGLLAAASAFTTTDDEPHTGMYL